MRLGAFSVSLAVEDIDGDTILFDQHVSATRRPALSPPYSQRSASVGAILAARRAGT